MRPAAPEPQQKRGRRRQRREVFAPLLGVGGFLLASRWVDVWFLGGFLVVCSWFLGGFLMVSWFLGFGGSLTSMAVDLNYYRVSG